MRWLMTGDSWRDLHCGRRRDNTISLNVAGTSPFQERSRRGLNKRNSHLRRRDAPGTAGPGNTQSLRHLVHANATTTKRWFSLSCPFVRRYGNMAYPRFSRGPFRQLGPGVCDWHHRCDRSRNPGVQYPLPENRIHNRSQLPSDDGPLVFL